jgi:cytosine deaminase
MDLHRVLVPRRVRAADDGLPDSQAYDVRLEGDRVASLQAVAGEAEGLLLPAFCDAHVHLDKTFTVREVGAAQGDLFAAIARMNEHRQRWTAADLHRRMSQALDEAWRAGTRAMRTHLDWPEAQPPTALAVFEQLRRDWAGRVELQFVSLTTLDLFEDEAAGEAIAREVARAGGVLGAFVYRNQRLDEKLARVLALAQRHGLALDFHVDEGLHADADGLRRIAREGAALGLSGRIACSHCCSLSVQPADEAGATLALCDQAGIDLIALPTTNLYLQGAWDATPLERGITRVHEAAAAGLRPSLASDNVADAFYPYGGYDLLETFALGVQVAHLAPALDWIDAVTVQPARAMRLAWDGRIGPGCPAELVLLAARDDYELMTPAGRRRTVIRQGQPL